MLPKQTSYSTSTTLSSSPYQTSSLMRRHKPEPAVSGVFFLLNNINICLIVKYLV